MIEERVDGVLDDWSPCCRAGIAWFVVGVVSEDKKGRFRDGALITTSMILTSPNEIKEGVVIKTLNSRYLLRKRATELRIDAFLYAASLNAVLIGLDGKPVTTMEIPDRDRLI